MTPTYSKTTFERELSDKGIPEDEKQSKGGKVPDRTKNYGLWMRFNQRPRFEALHKAWVAEKHANELREQGYSVNRT